MSSRKNYLMPFTAFLVATLVSGCLDSTSPTKIENVDQATMSYAEDLCQGAALTDSPFGNSSSGGDGLSAKTAYIICNAQQFNNIGSNSAYWSKYFVLLLNINLISYSVTTYNKIGNSTTPFTGVLDGNNKRIVNLTLNAPTSNYIGVFGALGTNGVIKNLQLSNLLMIGDDYVGILAGENQGGEIRNVTVSAQYVSGAGNYIGGLVGKNTLGSIYDSSVIFTSGSNSVSGYTSVGGLVGQMDAGLIQNSFVSGTGINAIGGNSGGLVGYNGTGGEIRFSYAKLTNTVSGGAGDNVGGVAGYNTGLIYKSYVEAAKVSGDDYIGGVVGFNDSGVVQESYSKISVWVKGSADIGGVIGHNATGTVLSVYTEAVLVTGTENNIGGLVGQNVSGPVTNSYAKVTTVSSTVVGTANLGGLVGLNGTGQIASSYAQTTNITASTGDQVGGLLGYNTSGEVTNSYAKSSTAITGRTYVGGGIGRNGSGFVSSSYSNVKNISSTNNYVGGFVGISEAGSIISKCYAQSSGVITGNLYLGGFIGTSAGQIVESYALPTTITGTPITALHTGGFAGSLASSQLMNVYVRSSGTLTGVTEVGGFVGTLADSSIVNSYAVWGLVQGTGESVGGHTGISTGSRIESSFSVSNVTSAGAASPPTVGLFMGTLPLAEDEPSPIERLLNTHTYQYSICSNTAGIGVCNLTCENTSAGLSCYSLDGVTLLFTDVGTTYELESLVDDPTDFYDKSNAPLSSWNFTTHWQENTSDYPTLR